MTRLHSKMLKIFTTKASKFKKDYPEVEKLGDSYWIMPLTDPKSPVIQLKPDGSFEVSVWIYFKNAENRSKDMSLINVNDMTEIQLKNTLRGIFEAK